VSVPITVDGLTGAAAAAALSTPGKKLTKKETKQLRKQGIAVPDSDDEAPLARIVIKAGTEMPEGAVESDDEVRKF
jgi:hypothetical protein